jgi:hypothetical protein
MPPPHTPPHPLSPSFEEEEEEEEEGSTARRGDVVDRTDRVDVGW